MTQTRDLFKFNLVRDGEDAEVHAGATVIDGLLDIGGNAVGTLIEDDEGRAVEEETRKGQLLLLPRAEVFGPVARVIQLRPDHHSVDHELQVGATVGRCGAWAALGPGKALVNLVVGAALAAHVLARHRIDYQVAQRPHRHEVDLREEVDFLVCRHGDGAGNEGPELADDAEER